MRLIMLVICVGRHRLNPCTLQPPWIFLLFGSSQDMKTQTLMMSQQAFSRQTFGAVTVGKSQVLTVTMAPLCLGVPVSHYSVTVTQQTQNWDPENWSIYVEFISFIINTWDFPALTKMVAVFRAVQLCAQTNITCLPSPQHKHSMFSSVVLKSLNYPWSQNINLGIVACKALPWLTVHQSLR